MMHDVAHTATRGGHPTTGAQRGAAGFTLVETMMALLILVIMAGVVTMGLPVAMDTYKKAVNSSNAQMLLSTTCTVLRDEIGLSSDVQTKGGVVYYLSEDGYWASIEKTGDGATARIKKRVYTGTIDDVPASEVEDSPFDIVTDATATSELGITYGDISKEDGLVTVTDLRVIDNEGNVLASTGSEAENKLVIRTLLVNEEEA